jgi:hypothetical protein
MAISTSLVLKFDGAAVKKGLARLNASMKRFGVGIAKAAGALAAFGAAGLAGMIAAAVKLNSIGEAARSSDARLQSITKQMGIFGDQSEKVSDRLLDLADAQARQLGIDDDVIAATQSKLMTFAELAKSADVMGGAFDRATMAAVDMAAAGFGTAEQNAVQLGKALNDPIKGINSLTRSGITFTAEQKKLIATLVETGKMGQVQNLVLKAIEAQVGGTAAATADASERIKVSLNQLVESFAKPFSQGFDGLPGALESIFPQLQAKAEAAGVIVSDAIKDSLAGNNDKLVAIGELIGDTIGGGIKIGLKSAMLNATESFFGFLEDINPIRKLNDQIMKERSAILSFGPKSDRTDKFGKDPNKMSDYIRENKSQVITGDLQDLISALKDKAGSLQSTGLVPNTQGRFRYAQPGESSIFTDGQGNKVIQLLTGINQKLSPQP